MKVLSILTVACGLMTASFAYAAVDAAAAQALVKKSDCMKCHAVDKTKVGPAFKDVAKKYAGKADAEATLVKKLTEIPGHKHVDSKDPAEIKNAVQWILSQ